MAFSVGNNVMNQALVRRGFWAPILAHVFTDVGCVAKLARLLDLVAEALALSASWARRLLVVPRLRVRIGAAALAHIERRAGLQIRQGSRAHLTRMVITPMLDGVEG